MIPFVWQRRKVSKKLCWQFVSHSADYRLYCPQIPTQVEQIQLFKKSGLNEHTHHLGLLVDLTTGDMPSLYRLLVLEKFTTLKMTLWKKEHAKRLMLHVHILKPRNKKNKLESSLLMPGALQTHTFRDGPV